MHRLYDKYLIIFIEQNIFLPQCTALLLFELTVHHGGDWLRLPQNPDPVQTVQTQSQQGVTRLTVTLLLIIHTYRLIGNLAGARACGGK